jgi:hypothetical protein
LVLVLSKYDVDFPLVRLGLLQVDDPASVALVTAVLPRHPAHKAFRSPVTLLQNRDGPAPAFRACMPPYCCRQRW